MTAPTPPPLALLRKPTGQSGVGVRELSVCRYRKTGVTLMEFTAELTQSEIIKLNAKDKKEYSLWLASQTTYGSIDPSLSDDREIKFRALWVIMLKGKGSSNIIDVQVYEKEDQSLMPLNDHSVDLLSEKGYSLVLSLENGMLTTLPILERVNYTNVGAVKTLIGSNYVWDNDAQTSSIV
jgi:hypothetical protein